jgi:hypothetical protein
LSFPEQDGDSPGTAPREPPSFQLSKQAKVSKKSFGDDDNFGPAAVLGEYMEKRVVAGKSGRFVNRLIWS